MSQIPKILGRLEGVEGTKGAALLTTDGIMVASTLGEEFIDDVVAGLSSFLISTTRRSLADTGLDGGFSRFTLHSTHGNVVLVDLGEAYLVVITNQFAGLDTCLTEIEETAAALRRVAKIDV